MQVATYLLVQLPNLLAPTYHLLITIACMYVTDTCLIVWLPCLAPTQSAMTTLVADKPWSHNGRVLQDNNYVATEYVACRTVDHNTALSLIYTETMHKCTIRMQSLEVIVLINKQGVNTIPKPADYATLPVWRTLFLQTTCKDIQIHSLTWMT